MLKNFKQLTTISKVAVFFAVLIVVFEIYSTVTNIISFKQEMAMYGELFSDNIGFVISNIVSSLLLPFGMVVILLQGLRYKQAPEDTTNIDNETIEENAPIETEEDILKEVEEIPNDIDKLFEETEETESKPKKKKIKIRFRRKTKE